MSSIESLLSVFNVGVRTDFNKKWKEFSPRYKELLYSFDGGFVESTIFPFFDFLESIEEFTGTRQYQSFPEGHTFRIVNKTFDKGIKQPVKTFRRCSNMKENRMAPLNICKTRISDLAKMAKDLPSTTAFKMMINGTNNTMGTTFDGQTYYSNTHSYSSVAGSQDNIVPRTGTTLATVKADILSALSRFNSFSYDQATNDPAIKLNDSPFRLYIIAPSTLEGVLHSLKTESFSNNTSNESVKNLFDYETQPALTGSDWYAFAKDDETIMKPFLHQVETAPRLDMAKITDESVKENDEFKWGVRLDHAIAYGAWWKAIKVAV